MKFESVGVLIDLRPFNERDAVARVLQKRIGHYWDRLAMCPGMHVWILSWVCFIGMQKKICLHV